MAGRNRNGQAPAVSPASVVAPSTPTEGSELSNSPIFPPTDPAAVSAPTAPLPEPKPVVQETPWQKLLRVSRANVENDELAKATWEYVQSKLPQDTQIMKKYDVLYLYDNNTMLQADADRIYSAAQKLNGNRALLLVLHSSGGHIAPAYFISKICRHYATSHEFVVAVPRMAKSAATLICCGADEIHMGLMSELGPIDPQIERMPALGLKNAIDHIAELVKKHPASAEMFASYLAKSLPLSKLGYYERVAESAAQYAERLMQGRKIPVAKSAGEVAKRLVYDYKDHGFVIDAKEAEMVFGVENIKRNTDEYTFANAAYNALDLAGSIIGMFAKKQMYFIGSGPEGFTFFPSEDEN